MKWDSEQYYQKAKLYMDRANSFEHNQMEFPLWSSLAIEMLARAALTSVHPVLNADPREPDNLFHALEIESKKQPKSIPYHAVLKRLEVIVESFGETQRQLCDYLGYLRNDELHSAELAFERLPESKWLPRYYEVCLVLVEFME